MRYEVHLMRRSTLLAPFLLAALSAPRAAHAVVVERVVAVIGDKPLLLSDLKRRARPSLFQLYASTATPTEIAIQEGRIQKDVLNRMVEERLVEQAAERAKKTISGPDVDRAIQTRAEALKLSVPALFQEAKRSGLTEQDYRDEIRRQLLEGKLIQLRLAGRLNITEDEGRAAYMKWVRDIGDDKLVDLRILPMRIPAGATEEQAARVVAVAQNVTDRVRKKEDFCDLVAQYSEDPAAKAGCGGRGMQPLSAFFGPIQEAARSLQTGEVSEPVRFRAGADEVVLVVYMVKAPGIPSFEDVKPQMMERALGDAVEKQRKLWLDELKRGVYIDVRI